VSLNAYPPHHSRATALVTGTGGAQEKSGSQHLPARAGSLRLPVRADSRLWLEGTLAIPTGVDWAEYDGEYRARIEASFERMSEALAALPRIHPELVVLHGDPVTEINGFAESVKAEMTVLGLKPRGPVPLAPGGGVAMKVVRASHRPVLLIPKKAPRAGG